MALTLIPKKFVNKKSKKRHVDIPLELSKSKNSLRSHKPNLLWPGLKRTSN